MIRSLAIVALCAVTSTLVACGTMPHQPVAAPAAASAPPSPPPEPPAPVAPAAAEPAPLPAYLDPSNPVSQQRSVFFDFDSGALRPDQMSVVEIQGRYLAAHPSVNVRIEGNTDERGSTEYNLALGQRRAEAVQKALSILGVSSNQMGAISWGKDHPRDAGHDEAAWSKNRRADVTYPSH